jgi:uridylate kinase
MRIVLRIGGSVIATPVNSELIKKYADMLRDLKEQGHKLVVVVGGGELAREFIRVAKDIGLDEPSQDEIAISVSRVFAQLFLMKVSVEGCRTVPLTVEEAKEFLAEGKIVIMGGLKPGMTTDAVAALVAEGVNADLLIKATDQDGIYDKDPRDHADAVKLDRLSFKDLSEVLAEDKHRAGIHQVIDPEAVRILKRVGIAVVVVNGFETNNVLKAIERKPVGTLIESF